MSLNETTLEKRFGQVSTSAGSIQSLSQLCLHYKSHHKKIAHIWLRSIQKADVKHRLTLIYLANDIVQNAKRKNALSFIEDFKSILKDTIPFLRDEKIKKPVERVFSIWQDRSIFDAKFTIDLKNHLNNKGKVTSEVSLDASKPLSTPNDLMSCLNKLANIEKNIGRIKSSDDNLIEQLREIDVSDSKLMGRLKLYISALKSEIDERNKLSRLLEDSMTTQKKLLRESESQLELYKAQLDQISKLRNDLG